MSCEQVFSLGDHCISNHYYHWFTHGLRDCDPKERGVMVHNLILSYILSRYTVENDIDITFTYPSSNLYIQSL